eukprot:379567-Hanusia_phi.AAC.7
MEENLAATSWLLRVRVLGHQTPAYGVFPALDGCVGLDLHRCLQRCQRRTRADAQQSRADSRPHRRAHGAQPGERGRAAVLDVKLSEHVGPQVKAGVCDGLEVAQHDRLFELQPFLAQLLALLLPIPSAGNLQGAVEEERIADRPRDSVTGISHEGGQLLDKALVSSLRFSCRPLLGYPPTEPLHSAGPGLQVGIQRISERNVVDQRNGGHCIPRQTRRLLLRPQVSEEATRGCDPLRDHGDRESARSMRLTMFAEGWALVRADSAAFTTMSA